MATKNISITEEAYKRLANLRMSNESFSEIIIKITKKNNWRDYFGVLSEKSANSLEKAILERRKLNAKLHTERTKMMAKELA
ncbi:MAG: antitoxin VapB family protein [Nanoarchaeota archaeon]